MALSLAAIASLSPALSPAVCRVDGSGLGRRGPFGWSRRAWGEVRRVAFGRSSVLVSPFSRPHWLDPYRALVLPLPGLNRSRLEADLRTLRLDTAELLHGGQEHVRMVTKKRDVAGCHDTLHDLVDKRGLATPLLAVEQITAAMEEPEAPEAVSQPPETAAIA